MILSREQCPSCLDSGNDNLIVKEDHAHCHACGHHEIYGEPIKANYSAPKTITNLIQGTYQDLPTRGIQQAVCERYGYSVGKYTGYLGKGYVEDETVHLATYEYSGTAVAQKVRNRDKKFTIKGDPSLMTLYGQWLYEPCSSKSVIIVEGEIDALTVSQVMGKSWAVVSVPNGAQNAHLEIRKQLEWLMGWGTVLLGLDSDEAGQKATKACLEIFDPSTVRTITWPAKDANELLLSGEAYKISEAIDSAKYYRPSSIVTANDIMSKILTRPTVGVSWPWPTLTQATYGIHPKKIYTIGAGSGIGKTEVLINLMCHLLEKEQLPVGALFLESTPEEIYLRTAGYFMKQRIHIPGCSWNEDEIRSTISKFNDKLFLYSLAEAGSQGATWASVKDKITYMVKGLGVKHIILDHLTALACHMKDERKELDSCMSELGGMVHSLDCTIFVISHLAKPMEGKGYEEGRIVTANAFRGSQSIQYWSAFMLGLERNKLAEDPAERLLTRVRVLKDRFSGEADGLTMYLKYDTITGRLNELGHSTEAEVL